MKPFAAALMSLALGAASAAWAQPASPGVAEQIASGRALVARNCGMCHAIGDSGASPNPNAPVFRQLHRRLDVESLGEGLATGILTQHPAMPEFRFSPHEVIAVVRYLRSIQDQQTS